MPSVHVWSIVYQQGVHVVEQEAEQVFLQHPCSDVEVAQEADQPGDSTHYKADTPV